MAKLTGKQKRFVDEYLIDLNATQAALRAGYSPKTAKDIGHENLTKPNIQPILSERQADREKRTEITQDWVLRELALIAGADMADFIEIDDGGAIRAFPLDTLAEGRSRIIRKVKEKRTIRTERGTKDKPDADMILDSTYEFELYDKLKGLELIGKHLGMFIEKLTDTEPPDATAYKMRESARLMEEKEYGTNA